tara:strand:+ start:125 stop:451 length:327 start_codon:yes stop_codon:yes gene_type:complete
MQFNITTYQIVGDTAVITSRGFDDAELYSPFVKLTIANVSPSTYAEVYIITTVLDAPSANLRFDANASTVDAETAASTVLDHARYVRREGVRDHLRTVRQQSVRQAAT